MDRQSPATLIVSARRLLFCVAALTGALVALHTIGQLLRFVLGHNDVKGFVALFNLENEMNAPSIWSSLLLLEAAVLLLLVGRESLRRGAPRARHWVGLSALFAALSADELLSLHELTIEPLRNALHLSGALYYAWFIPAVAAAAAIGLLYIPFLLSLPRSTRTLFIVAGGSYVFAAVAFEFAEGMIDQAGGWMNLPYTVLVTIEESMEMGAICLFIYAIARYAARAFAPGTGESPRVLWLP